MIRRFYTWLRLQFLPEWARRQLVEENQRLVRALAEARQEIERLESCIEGMQEGRRRGGSGTLTERGESDGQGK